MRKRLSPEQKAFLAPVAAAVMRTRVTWGWTFGKRRRVLAIDLMMAEAAIAEIMQTSPDSARSPETRPQGEAIILAALIATAMNPDLFSTDAETAHHAASPFKVSALKMRLTEQALPAAKAVLARYGSLPATLETS